MRLSWVAPDGVEVCSSLPASSNCSRLLALMWGPPVILLDEATSAIDNASDAAFRAALHAIVKKQNNAVLTIAPTAGHGPRG